MGVMTRVLTSETIGAHVKAFAPDGRDRLAATLDAPAFVGRLDASIVTSLGMESRDVMSRLLPLAQCYAQAGFRVGAVVQGASGALYLGANLELPGAPLGWTVHAEQSAVLGALVRGERSLKRLMATASPCGHCRQFLWELADAGDLEVLIPDSEPVTLAQLLPHSFGPGDLGVTAGLLVYGSARVQADTPSDPLVRAALHALRMSYAPYTNSPSAVGLEAGDGVLVAAPYVENAAYNPSLSPMMGALDRLRFHSALAGSIQRAVLVEVDGAAIGQASAAASMVTAAAPGTKLAVLEVRLAAN